MPEAKHIFIINPAAGQSDHTTEAASRIAESARRAEIDYEIYITEYPRHASEIVKEIALNNTDGKLRFYACGGDGTLNEVANGVQGLKNVSFTHFPIGSGNDFIKIFGNGAEEFRSIESLIGGEIIPLDYISSDCGASLNVLSVGVDARVAAGMQKYKRIPMLRGESAYIASTVENVIRGLHRPYGVEIDGQCFDGRYTMIVAANGCCYGGGFYAVPDADPTDGFMDILLVGAVSRLGAAKIIGGYKAGRYKDMPQIITHIRGKEMTISSKGSEQMEVNLDGEMAYVNKVSINVAQDKANFIVPIGVVPNFHSGLYEHSLL